MTKPARGGPVRVHLVRHGETAWALTGQHTCKTDIPLTEPGERQALDLAPALRGVAFDMVLTSPSIRAQRTCILAGFGDERVTATDLAEWDYGDYNWRS